MKANHKRAISNLNSRLTMLSNGISNKHSIPDSLKPSVLKKHPKVSSKSPNQILSPISPSPMNIKKNPSSTSTSIQTSDTTGLSNKTNKLNPLIMKQKINPVITNTNFFEKGVRQRLENRIISHSRKNSSQSDVPNGIETSFKTDNSVLSNISSISQNRSQYIQSNRSKSNNSQKINKEVKKINKIPVSYFNPNSNQVKIQKHEISKMNNTNMIKVNKPSNPLLEKFESRKTKLAMKKAKFEENSIKKIIPYNSKQKELVIFKKKEVSKPKNFRELNTSPFVRVQRFKLEKV